MLLDRQRGGREVGSKANFTWKYTSFQLQLYYLPLVFQAWGIALSRPSLSDCTLVAGHLWWKQCSVIPGEVLFADLSIRLCKWKSSIASPAWAGVRCAYINFPGPVNCADPKVKHLHFTQVSSHAFLSDNLLPQTDVSQDVTQDLQTSHFAYSFGTLFAFDICGQIRSFLRESQWQEHLDAFAQWQQTHKLHNHINMRFA